MNKEKMILNVFVDSNAIIFQNDMPEVLKKHFQSMAITVNTIKQLTNNKEFNDITCKYIIDENDEAKTNMLFTFDGKELTINITSPLKKETLPLKEDLCFIRDSFLHSYIKETNTVYIIESKPKNFTTALIKLYSSKGLVKEFLINSSVINAQKLYMFFREEKKLINNYFKYNNVISYEKLNNAHITELRDKYKSIEYIGVKQFIKNLNTIIEVNKSEQDDKVTDYNLNELDELLYQTGLISVKDIKDEIKRKENIERNKEKAEKKEENI